MGAREDFMAVRRAAVIMSGATDPVELATAALLTKAGSRELYFLEMCKRPFYPEVIDLAYAILGEERPGEGGEHALPPS